jgi:polyisoprenyl-phosphate glycosyltransferase
VVDTAIQGSVWPFWKNEAMTEQLDKNSERMPPTLGNAGAPSRQIDPAPEISVVVPSYGCRDCLTTLCQRLDGVLRQLVSSFEIIIVDDRSPDNSWPVVEALAQRFPFIRGIRLSRNFGQQVAMTAGLQAAHGKYVVVMDCDLQDPPERIPDLLRELQKGYDLVMAKRVERSHSGFRLVAAKAYYQLVRRLTGETVDGEYGSFSILSRKVVDAFLLFNERERHYIFILHWLGFNRGTIEYAHEDRATGHSSYSFGKLVRHALSGLFFQTSAFLNWIMYAGLFFTLTSFAAGAYFIYRHFVVGALPGWTSLVVAILFSTGMILASVGAVGLYISRIFEMSKGRPLYIVDQECGCCAQPNPQ